MARNYYLSLRMLCSFMFSFNPHVAIGGKMTPQTDLFTAISKPLGVNRNALVTFPKYGWATKWPKISIATAPEIQYGGRQTGDQYSSVCILRIQSQHGLYGKQGRNNNGLPHIPGSQNYTTMFQIPPAASGRRKSKMAAAKLVMNIYADYK